MLKYLLKLLKLYSYYGSYLSLRFAFVMIFGALCFGVIGFVIIEDYTFLEAIFMAVITISTVGFEEVHPLSDEGQVFTTILIFINIGVFAYGLSAFTSYVVQGELFKNVHMAFISDRIAQLEDHVILCGFGKYGKEVVDHFYKHKINFVILEIDGKRIKKIQKDKRKLLYIHDDATNDEILISAGIKVANSIVCALTSDHDNLFTVLTARQLNPGLNIISRANNPKSEPKLKLAGADHIILPDQIGGFYMATLVTKPGAVEFFSFITNEYASDVGFEEIKYHDLPKNLRGKALEELAFRRKTGANIIGFKNPEGKYIVNPKPHIVLTPGSSFIVLGNNVQLDTLKKYLHRE